MKYIFSLLFFIIVLSGCTKPTGELKDTYRKGNVIFIHPDGTGLANWNAARLLYYGPDSSLNWDKMTSTGIYRSHIANTLVSSSNAGATVHAYGVKADYLTYGMTDGQKATAFSGKQKTILEEAKDAGYRTGIVNSGSIIEPGTGVFAAYSETRSNYEEITEQIVKSGTDVIFSGGEEWLLPEGTRGRFAEGKRTDSLNLIDYAKNKGYFIVYTAEELKNIPDSANKVLGVFAENHTFNDKPEEELQKKKLGFFKENAPTIAEMTSAALKILTKDGNNFFLVVEEEATDNMGNKNNAAGMLEALKRADDAIGEAIKFIDENPNTLLVTAADSEAGGMEVYAYPKDRMDPEKPLPDTTRNGAPLDGRSGTGTLPFMSAPDAMGNTYPFGIAWSCYDDVYGSVVAKGYGLNSQMINGSVDNTHIYKVMYTTLFGELPGSGE